MKQSHPAIKAPYPTYQSAQKALFDEIPDDIVKSKQFRVQRYK